MEILAFEPQSPRTTQMYAALIETSAAAGVRIVLTKTYLGASDLLMLWGPGHPSRFSPMRGQLARGGHVVALDLAYWSRDTKLRVSIDAAHPQAWVMRRDWPVDRWQADSAPVANVWDPDGPVVVAGLGRKARAQYGADQIDAWEAEMIRACRERWARPVLYRRKRDDVPAPDGVTPAPPGPIDDVLRSLCPSLVITWHSNVAVDAIRMGIPVVCRDGAAAAVCPSQLPERPMPLAADVREKFLANLAWFQWAPTEAQACWRFLCEVLA